MANTSTKLAAMLGTAAALAVAFAGTAHAARDGMHGDPAAAAPTGATSNRISTAGRWRWPM